MDLKEFICIGDTENTKEYIARICSGKSLYNLNWYQIRDICNEALGVSFSESYYRKNYTNGVFCTLNDSSNSCNETDTNVDEQDELQNLLAELKAERIKLSEERTANNASVRRLVREDTCKEIAVRCASQLNDKLLLDNPNNKFIKIKENKAIATICDWHYGICIDNYWNKYDPEICKNRVKQLLDKTLDICKKNDVSEIYVINLADLIAGRIHSQIRIQSRYDVISQIIQISEIVAEYLCKLSTVGKMAVHYYDCLDNHSRIEPNKNESLDLESLARITPWFLKERLKYHTNITIHNNEYSDDIISFTCNNFRFAGVHGDRDKP